MRIFVVNLKEKSISTRTSIIALTIIVLIAIFVSSVAKIFRNDIFVKASTESNAERIIIIDPGHGGEDGGAIGKNGVYEKDLNLEISLLIGSKLEEEGFAVVYTRTDDRMLYSEAENIKGLRKISDLRNRCKVAGNYPEAVFISIHMNSFSQEKYSGLQVYYSEDESSQLLAGDIQNAVRESLQPDNERKIKPGKDLYILENIENTAVLIECGFLSNLYECEKLSEKEYQKQLSFSIVCGIIEYINEK